MSYQDWKGYKVRRGATIKSCAFILPEIVKTMKFVNSIEDDNLKPLERLKNSLKRACEGSTNEEKTAFLKEYCGVASFKEFETMTDFEIKKLIEIIG